MDITELKQAVEEVVQIIERDSHPFKFVGLIPAYPGVADTSYILQVSADWLDNYTCTDNSRYVIDKLYQHLSPELLRYINRLDIYSPGGYLHCMSPDLILRNEINYKPDDRPQYAIA